MIDIEKLRRLCEAATPGPWYRKRLSARTGDKNMDAFYDLISESIVYVYPPDGPDAETAFIQSSPENAAFIEAARTAVPALLDEVDRLRIEIERLREVLMFYADPQVYAPHPHGIAFDTRDLSFLARRALEREGQ